ncbi:hypothetical protein F4802DRAFT_227641 [Xylaria palmicola]|nr:hypothetical protein F4802DRAFT_227641 [Xylaria palmicola]
MTTPRNGRYFTIWLAAQHPYVIIVGGEDRIDIKSSQSQGHCTANHDRSELASTLINTTRNNCTKLLARLVGYILFHFLCRCKVPSGDTMQIVEWVGNGDGTDNMEQKRCSMRSHNFISANRGSISPDMLDRAPSISQAARFPAWPSIRCHFCGVFTSAPLSRSSAQGDHLRFSWLVHRCRPWCYATASGSELSTAHLEPGVVHSPWPAGQ